MSARKDLVLACPSCSKRFVFRPYSARPRVSQVGTGKAEPLPEGIHSQPKGEDKISPGQTVSDLSVRVGKEPATAGRARTRPTRTVALQVPLPKARRSHYVFSPAFLLAVAGAVLVGMIAAYIIVGRQHGPIRMVAPSGSPEVTSLDDGSLSEEESSLPEKELEEAAQSETLEDHDLVIPIFSMEVGDPCTRIVSLEAQTLARGPHTDRCEQFTSWLAYLIDDSVRAASCPLDSVLVRALQEVSGPRTCGRACTFLGCYYLEKGLREKALSMLEQARTVAPNDPWVYVLEARWAQVTEENPQNGIEYLKKGIAVSPELLHAHYLLALAYIEAGAYQEAQDEFVWLAPRVGERERADTIAALLRQVVSTAPLSVPRVRSLLELANVLEQLHVLRVAEAVVRQALIEMDTTIPSQERKLAFFELGKICEQRGKDRQAYAAYQNALRIDPDFMEARVCIKRLGSVVGQEGTPNDATRSTEPIGRTSTSQ